MPTDLNGQAAGQAGAELVRDELAPQFESVTGNCNATAYAFLTDRCSHATVTRAVNTNGWVTVYIDDTHIYR